MRKFLKHKDIFGLIMTKLNQRNCIEIRKISEEFNKLFETYYVKRKTIRFNIFGVSGNLCMIRKYNILKVDLAHCFIIDKDLNYLSNCEEISIRGCNKITDQGLSYLVNCKKICLNGCRNITDEGLKYLSNCIYINLALCNKITDYGLNYLANCETINLNKCINITGGGLNYLNNCKILYY